jgi:hypothetical protein
MVRGTPQKWYAGTLALPGTMYLNAHKISLRSKSKRSEAREPTQNGILRSKCLKNPRGFRARIVKLALYFAVAIPNLAPLIRRNLSITSTTFP